MTAFSDARASLVSSIADNRTTIGTQDTAPQLLLAFGRLTTVGDLVKEWVSAEVSLRSIVAANEVEFNASIGTDAFKGLRADAQRFLEQVQEARRTLIKLAEKARTLPAL